MTFRENALAVLHYEKFDHLPVVSFGYWNETVEKWANEGHITHEEAENYARFGDNGSGDRSVSYTMDGWTGEEFAFEGAGFSVNPVMPEIYETLNETYQHAENEGPANEYDPGEPSVDEIAAANPDYAASFAEYGDAAIVVLGRPSAESTDYIPGGIVDGLGAEEPLALTTNELEAVELAKQASDNVIVLVNTATAVEVKEMRIRFMPKVMMELMELSTMVGRPTL